MNPTQFLPDPRKDEIGQLLNYLQSKERWTKDKRLLKKEIIEKLEKLNYQYFYLNHFYYPVGITGNSFLYQVPEKRRGLLLPYRGKLIRLITVGSGKFDRLVMIKEME